MDTLLQQIPEEKAFRGSANERIPNLPVKVFIDEELLIGQALYGSWVESDELNYVKSVSFAPNLENQQDPRVVKFPLSSEQLDIENKEDSMKERMTQREGSVVREMALRLSPFFVFMIIAILAISNPDWTRTERVAYLVSGIALFCLTIFTMFVRLR